MSRLAFPPMRRAATAILFLSLTTAVVGQETKPAAATGMTADARKVVDQAIEAMGGAKAFKSVKSARVKIKMASGGPQEVELEVSTMGEEKLHARQPIPQLGMELTMARNGDHAWVDVPMQGIQVVSTDQIKQIGDLATVQFFLTRLEKEYGTVDTAGNGEAAGQECMKLRLANPKDPGPNDPPGDSFLYIAKKTNLPVMMESPAQPGQPTKAMFDDYKPFGDLKLFTKITAMQGTTPQVLTFTEVSFNDVDPALFEVPSEVAGGATTQPAGSP